MRLEIMPGNILKLPDEIMKLEQLKVGDIIDVNVKKLYAEFLLEEYNKNLTEIISLLKNTKNNSNISDEKLGKTQEENIIKSPLEEKVNINNNYEEKINSNNSIDTSNDDVIKIDSEEDCETEKINNIKLSGSSKFKPNLEKAKTFYKKYYSDCGLLVRTKNSYVKMYCEQCQGQMIAEEDREKYCPYAKGTTFNNDLKNEEVKHDDYNTFSNDSFDVEVDKDLGDTKESKEEVDGTDINVSTIEEPVEDNIVENNDITDVSQKEENLEEIKQPKINKSDIRLNPKSKFKPNIFESLKFNTKCYSDCGLVIKAKIDSVQKYCEKCHGDMICAEQREIICPFASKTVDEVAVENDEEKPSLVSTLKEDIRKNTEVLQKTIDNQIDYLNNSISKDEDLEDYTETLAEDTQQRKRTSIVPIRLKTYRQCYMCEEYKNSGFIIDNEYFYCKECAVLDFKSFLKERGK